VFGLIAGWSVATLTAAVRVDARGVRVTNWVRKANVARGDIAGVDTSVGLTIRFGSGQTMPVAALSSNFGGARTENERARRFAEEMTRILGLDAATAASPSGAAAPIKVRLDAVALMVGGAGGCVGIAWLLHAIHG
jgi:hypothetical protein